MLSFKTALLAMMMEQEQELGQLRGGEATLEMRKISSTQKWVEKTMRKLVEEKKFLVPDGPVKYLPLIL